MSGYPSGYAQNSYPSAYAQPQPQQTAWQQPRQSQYQGYGQPQQQQQQQITAAAAGTPVWNPVHRHWESQDKKLSYNETTKKWQRNQFFTGPPVAPKPPVPPPQAGGSQLSYAQALLRAKPVQHPQQQQQQPHWQAAQGIGARNVNSENKVVQYKQPIQVRAGPPQHHHHHHHHQPQKPAGGGGGGGNKKWPPSLVKYVERCFAACPKSNSAQKRAIESQLKATIENAVSTNALHTIDWVLKPLPVACSQHTRTSRFGAAQAATGQKRFGSPLQADTTRLTKKQRRLAIRAAKKKGKGQNQRKPKFGVVVGMPGFGPDPRENARRNDRSQRFAAHLNQMGSSSSQRMRLQFGADNADDDLDWDSIKVQGTCTKLEKNYFRLTSAPDPSVVRPLHILRRTLAMLRKRWSNQDEKNYPYLQDQIKSMRQDMKVQHIAGEFAVEVYEFNARCCLEMGDLSEYNQCQTQLKMLYHDCPSSRTHLDEFLAYRLLYYVFTQSKQSIVRMWKDVTTYDRKQPALAHAWQMYEHWENRNYVKFLALHKAAPNLGSCISEHLVWQLRHHALKRFCKSYMSLPVDYITKILDFRSTDDCLDFLTCSGASVNEDETKLDCKNTDVESLELWQPDASEADEEKGVTHGAFTNTKKSAETFFQSFLKK